MFNKKPAKSRNIRRKDHDSPTDMAVDSVALEIVEPIFEETKKEKKPKTKSTLKSVSVNLSFGDEEEGEEGSIQIKKSAASKRLAKERKLQLPQHLVPDHLDQATLTPPSSSYTPEALEQLRNNTPSTPAALKSIVPAADSDTDLTAEKFPTTMGVSLRGAAIPDAGAIHAAKKKRELARQGVKVRDEKEEDFISLDEAGSSTQVESRLVREEDEVGDADEEYEKYVGERMLLGKKAVKEQEKRRKAGVQELIEDAEETGDDDDDDEMTRWETEAIRKGGVKKKSDISVAAGGFASAPPKRESAAVPATISAPNLTDVMKRLAVTSSTLHETHRNHSTQLAQIKKDIAEIEAGREELERELERSGKRYNYYQEVRNYVADLGEFLDAKFPELEKIESEYHDIVLGRTNFVAQRRRQDDLDDLCLFADFPQDILTTLEEPEGQVDEFGRAITSRNSKAARARRRSERERRRALRTEVRGQGGEAEEGMSTDEDKAGTVQDGGRIEEIRSITLPALFSDVTEDFRTLTAVKSKFETWKSDFYDDYIKAYGSLSLPGAFEFFIRCELVTWSPFLAPQNFETMQWHTILSDYGDRDDGGAEDTDATLLNKLVEKVLIPRIVAMIDTLDVGSGAQMTNALDTVEQVLYYVEKQDAGFKDLIKAFMEYLEKLVISAVDLVRRITIREGPSDLDLIKARDRVFWRNFKIYRNLLPWKSYIPPDTMLSVVSEQLVDGVLLKLVSADDVALVQKIFAIMPKELMSQRHVEMAAMLGVAAPH